MSRQRHRFTRINAKWNHSDICVFHEVRVFDPVRSVFGAAYLTLPWGAPLKLGVRILLFIKGKVLEVD